MNSQRNYENLMTVYTSDDTEQDQRCFEETLDLFACLKIGSDNMSKYSSCFMLNENYTDQINSGKPLFQVSKKRKTFDIDISQTQHKNLRRQPRLIIIKKWKNILRKILPVLSQKLSPDEYSSLSTYLNSLNYSLDAFRFHLGFSNVLDQKNEQIFIENQGFDQIRRVLLTIIQSNYFIQTVLKNKTSWKQKILTLSSLTSLRDFIINPNQDLQIQ